MGNFAHEKFRFQGVKNGLIKDFEHFLTMNFYCGQSIKIFHSHRPYNKVESFRCNIPHFQAFSPLLLFNRNWALTKFACSNFSIALFVYNYSFLLESAQNYHFNLVSTSQKRFIVHEMWNVLYSISVLWARGQQTGLIIFICVILPKTVIIDK